MDPLRAMRVFSKVVDEGSFAAAVARSEAILCASPEYLDRRGRPQLPTDLLQHGSRLSCLGIRPICCSTAAGCRRSTRWPRGITFVTGEGAAVQSVTVMPRRPVLSTTPVDTMYAAALHGLGVAGLPSLVPEDALLEHALERVLPAWRLFSMTLWATLPSRKHLPVRTRVFLDFLIATFGGEDRDPWLSAAGCETQAWNCPDSPAPHSAATSS